LDITTDLKKAKRGAIAKAISIFENDEKESRKLIKKIFKTSGKSVVIGITGPAGAGKSSLIDKISIKLKKSGLKPAVLAIDPTSHISGGAILGDRVRMTESTDSGTYIRSIASRGATGAISRSIRNSVRVLEYAGFDPIIIESVGAGQTEIDISNVADITVVVFNPHTGDSIQTIKAGITEIGDIYLVHKRDLEGAVDYLNGRDDLSNKDYGIFGISMGGAVGVVVASEREEIKAVVVDSIYPDLKESIRRHIALMYGPISKIISPFVCQINYFAPTFEIFVIII